MAYVFREGQKHIDRQGRAVLRSGFLDHGRESKYWQKTMN